MFREHARDASHSEPFVFDAETHPIALTNFQLLYFSRINSQSKMNAFLPCQLRPCAPPPSQGKRRRQQI